MTSARQAVLAAVTPDDLQAIVRQLIHQSREGDVSAARLVFSSTIGAEVDQPTSHDEEGPTRTTFPPPPSANGFSHGG